MTFGGSDGSGAFFADIAFPQNGGDCTPRRREPARQQGNVYLQHTRGGGYSIGKKDVSGKKNEKLRCVVKYGYILLFSPTLCFWPGGSLSCPKREDRGSIPCGEGQVLMFWC